MPSIFLQRNKRAAFFFGLLFYLCLNLEVTRDLQSFFACRWPIAFAGYFLQASLYAFLWALFVPKQKSAHRLFVTSFLFQLLLILPPLGCLVWVQPLSAGGAFFPLTSWVGILVVLVLGSSFTASLTKQAPSLYPILTILLFCFSIACNILYSPPKPPINFLAIDTHLGKANPDFFMETARQKTLLSLIKNAHQTHGQKNIFLLPENMTTNLAGDQAAWRDSLPEGTTVLIGEDRGTESGVAVLSKYPGKTLRKFYRESVPMPLGEWKPFKKNSYHAHWFQAETIDLNTTNHHKSHTQTIAFLICYETMIPWPLIHTFLHQKNISAIVVLSNQWFSVASGYQKQLLFVRAFARTFGVPVLISTNYPARISTSLFS